MRFRSVHFNMFHKWLSYFFLSSFAFFLPFGLEGSHFHSIVSVDTNLNLRGLLVRFKKQSLMSGILNKHLPYSLPLPRLTSLEGSWRRVVRNLPLGKDQWSLESSTVTALPRQKNCSLGSWNSVRSQFQFFTHDLYFFGQVSSLLWASGFSL